MTCFYNKYRPPKNMTRFLVQQISTSKNMNRFLVQQISFSCTTNIDGLITVSVKVQTFNLQVQHKFINITISVFAFFANYIN